MPKMIKKEAWMHTVGFLMVNYHIQGTSDQVLH